MNITKVFERLDKGTLILRLVCVLLCLWLAWLGYQYWVLQQALDVPVSDLESSNPSAPNVFPQNPAAIAALFGMSLQTASPTVSTAPLILLASFVAADETSRALISGPNGPRMYRIGQTLSAGGKLRQVFLDHVVLLRNGREEILSFPMPDETILKPYVPSVMERLDPLNRHGSS